MIDRRTVTKGLVAGGAAIAAAPFLRGGFVSPAKARQSAPKLAIPALDQGKMVDGVRVFDLRIQKGLHEFVAGLKTPTLGVNAQYLGSTLYMNDGDRVRFNVTNSIGEPTTLHWHGLHLPAKDDGGPHQVIEDGQTWSPEFTIKQHASMFWYHSHMHKQTASQVWRGLAGAMIVDDDHSRGLDLPSTYGVDDIPLVLQDRNFNSDGSLHYSTGRHNTMMGNTGIVLLANGSINASFDASTKLLRLRLLNGSNARFYNVGFDDNRSFYQIASDGGLLPQPVRMTRVALGPGERAQIVVDLSDGKPVMLRNYVVPGSMGMGGMMGRMMSNNTAGGAVDFVKIVPTAAQTAPVAALPEKLLSIPRLKPSDAVKTRRFFMQMRMGPQVMLGFVNPLTINGKVMDMNRIDETVKMGDTEIWEITNRSSMPHPFHVHDVQFQILDRDGRPPAPHERGLKDTVVVNRGEVVRVIAKFEDYSDPEKPYMYHCHILEHEDAGMMGQFVVVA